jgi:tRNA modification GTPase
MNESTLYLREDTIAALSTAQGLGAVAVIRISGNTALDVASTIFQPMGKSSLNNPRVCCHGTIIDPDTNETIDDVLCTAFHAPSSYTGEHVVEINCHGSPAVVRKIIEMLYQHGARPAEPGEFTFRAVHNGKMDVAQAEGVAALIESRSQLARSLSLRMLEGVFSSDLQKLKEDTVSVLVEIETQIEFPDDSMEESICQNLEERTQQLFDQIQHIQKNAVRQQRFEQGIITVLAGKPNVGKSSLFNRLLGKERAIVTPHPGTTRDSIEGTIELQGCPVTLVDTAGLRETQEEIEAIGIERSKQLLTTSHIILFVFEAADGITPKEQQLLDEIAAESKNSHLILVANKKDQLSNKVDITTDLKLIYTSATAENGMNELIETLEETVQTMIPAEGENSYMITNRQERILDECTQTLSRIAEWMKDRQPMELLAEELHTVLGHIAKLDGTGITPDIMGTIFSTFCIGK